MTKKLKAYIITEVRKMRCVFIMKYIKRTMLLAIILIILKISSVYAIDGVVLQDGIRIRKGPSTDTAIVTVLNKEAPVEITCNKWHTSYSDTCSNTNTNANSYTNCNTYTRKYGNSCNCRNSKWNNKFIGKKNSK